MGSINTDEIKQQLQALAANEMLNDEQKALMETQLKGALEQLGGLNEIIDTADAANVKAILPFLPQIKNLMDFEE